VVITPSPFLDLVIVLRNLRGQVGGWCGRGLVPHLLGILLSDRLAGLVLRIERMTARFLAGTMWRNGARVRTAPGEDVVAVRRGAGRWPGGFGWLIRMAGWQSAAYGSQLRAVLETPEMVALLAASPQAGRLLRPVCRMLGVESSLLQPGVAVVERVAVVRERVRKARVKVVVEPFRVPLPRGVLAWARREGFGKIR
jgi:hypothetical protein